MNSYISNRSEYLYPKNRLTETFSVASLGRIALDQETKVLSALEIDDSSREVMVIGAGSIHPMVDTLDQHRAKFVRDMGWMPSDHMTDFDEYDDPARWTFSFVDLLHDESGEDVIVSSLRLTRLDSLDDCMSLRMVDADRNDLPSDAIAKITEAEEADALYDLTRLLPPSKKGVSTADYFESVVKLIGYGVEHTATGPEVDPVWLFATTAGLHAKLDRLGMPNEVLITRQENGKSRTVLCLVRPREALAYLDENKDRYEATYKNVQRGILEAGRTLSV